ncbi:unnamed protein product, partial [Symbiodinium natans]
VRASEVAQEAAPAAAVALCRRLSIPSRAVLKLLRELETFEATGTRPRATGSEALSRLESAEARTTLENLGAEMALGSRRLSCEELHAAILPPFFEGRELPCSLLPAELALGPAVDEASFPSNRPEAADQKVEHGGEGWQRTQSWSGTSRRRSEWNL